jgi:hypothetical protein
MQAQDIIIGAFTLNGYNSTTLDTTADIIGNLVVLNQEMATMSMSGLLIQSTVDQGFPLTANLGVYKIGSTVTSPNFTTARPYRIESAYIVDAKSVHYEVYIETNRSTFNDIVDQELSSSRPNTLYYDIGIAQQANPVGTIYISLLPDTANTYTLHLVMVQPVTPFTTVSDTVTFDLAYVNLLQSRLAIRLAPMYNIPVSKELSAINGEYERTIRLQTIRPLKLKRQSGVTSYVSNYVDGYTGFPGGNS